MLSALSDVGFDKVCLNGATLWHRRSLVRPIATVVAEPDGNKLLIGLTIEHIYLRGLIVSELSSDIDADSTIYRIELELFEDCWAWLERPLPACKCGKNMYPLYAVHQNRRFVFLVCEKFPSCACSKLMSAIPAEVPSIMRSKRFAYLRLRPDTTHSTKRYREEIDYAAGDVVLWVPQWKFGKVIEALDQRIKLEMENKETALVLKRDIVPAQSLPSLLLDHFPQKETAEEVLERHSLKHGNLDSDEFLRVMRANGGLR